MTGPFRIGELQDADEALGGTAEQADLLSVGRELEILTRHGDIAPSEGFTDRVMATLAGEAMPHPVAAAGVAIRGGRIGQVLTAVADSWRIAWSGGRPFAVRFQAAALVLVAVAVLGSAGGLAAVGAWSAFGPHDRASAPIVVPGPSQIPSTSPPAVESSPSPLPMESAQPTESAEPTETAEPTRTPRTATPKPTVHPTETPEGTDDHGGGGGSDDGTSGDTSSGGSGSGH